MKVGSTERIKIDVRLIAATNENLEKSMSMGKFREDLFYRLQVFPIVLPDLKDRKEDIPLLAYHFLDRFAKEEKKELKGISKKAMRLLLEYHWPGNVRELENVIERAVIMADLDHLMPKDLLLDRTDEFSMLIKKGVKGHKPLEYIKSEYIREMLKETGGNKKLASEILGVSPKTLYRFGKKDPPK